MIRRPPRSTQSRSSAASDVYKRQVTGTFTDVSVIASYIPKPTINISVGFNNEHTNQESLDIQAAYHTYEILCKELPNLINKQFRDMKCITYMYRSNIDTYDLYEEIL